MSEIRSNEEEHGAGKWDAYGDTVLEFAGPPPLRVDLREPPAADLKERLGALGLDGPFAVYTPENPDGRNAEDAPTSVEESDREAENVRRRIALTLELALLERPWVAVDGVAPDGSYREHCVAVRMGVEEARERAARHRQLAWFWWDGSAFWLMPALADGTPTRLGRGR